MPEAASSRASSEGPGFSGVRRAASTLSAAAWNLPQGNGEARQGLARQPPAHISQPHRQAREKRLSPAQVWVGEKQLEKERHYR